MLLSLPALLPFHDSIFAIPGFWSRHSTNTPLSFNFQENAHEHEALALGRRIDGMARVKKIKYVKGIKQGLRYKPLFPAGRKQIS
jgi:hypothetical protein